MKKLLSAALGFCLLFMAACHENDSSATKQAMKDSNYAIIGKVTGQDSGIIYMLHRQSGLTDSTKLDHGYFKFNGKADTAEFCRIGLDNQSVGFFLENGKISMLIKKDSLSSALISGTKVQEEYNYFQNTYSKKLNDKATIVDNAYEMAIAKKDQKTEDSLIKIYDVLDREQKQLVTDYTKSYPSSYVSVYEIYSNFSYNPPVEQLDSLYNMLDTSVRAGYFGKLIAKTIVKERLTAIGKPAPDFTNDDVNGKPVSLASTRGKYVLVDFWASWCGPCRRENPNVVKAYQAFHGKGFDIFGVSLDHDKTKWVDAIKKDGLNWTQVSDLKGWKADVVALYGIQGIPMNYLLDKNGIIVAKGLRGDELDGKLKELIH